MIQLAELANVLVIAWFLATELKQFFIISRGRLKCLKGKYLVAREAEDNEVLLLVFIIEILETFVLRGESTNGEDTVISSAFSQ